MIPRCHPVTSLAFRADPGREDVLLRITSAYVATSRSHLASGLLIPGMPELTIPFSTYLRKAELSGISTLSETARFPTRRQAGRQTRPSYAIQSIAVE